MKWSDRTQVIVNTLASMHPELVQGDDEARRTLTGYFAEQCRYEFGPAWGRKRYGGGPPSADVICYRDGSVFVGWDTQLAGGMIAQFPDSIDLSTDPQQIFIEVAPVNRLGTTPVPQPTPPPSTDLSEVLRRLDDIENKLIKVNTSVELSVDIAQDIIDLLNEGDIDFPSYEGSFKLNYFGTNRFTLTPVE